MKSVLRYKKSGERWLMIDLILLFIHSASRRKGAASSKVGFHSGGTATVPRPYHTAQSISLSESWHGPLEGSLEKVGKIPSASGANNQTFHWTKAGS